MKKMSIDEFVNFKKAILHILATLLLIVIAVVAIVVSYAWTTTYMGSATSQAGARFYIENVRFDTGATEMTIGRAGTEDTRIVRVWLGDSDRNMTDITDNTDV